MACKKLSGSKRGTVTSLAPWASPSKVTTVKPLAWNMGSKASMVLMPRRDACSS